MGFLECLLKGDITISELEWWSFLFIWIKRDLSKGNKIKKRVLLSSMFLWYILIAVFYEIVATQSKMKIKKNFWKKVLQKFWKHDILFKSPLRYGDETSRMKQSELKNVWSLKTEQRVSKDFVLQNPSQRFRYIRQVVWNRSVNEIFYFVSFKMSLSLFL
jgi:hypothetical protein